MLSTRINNRAVVNEILQWCVGKWGYSEYQNTLPKLTLYKSSGSSRGIRGEYISEKNRIVVFLGDIDSYEELCSVVIHEYTHYLLNSDEYDDLYFELLDTGKTAKEVYRLHPHEKKCRLNAKNYNKECYIYIKNKSQVLSL